jgi:prepilin-type N-terminal cleavage/methylation domain-containing protein
MSSEQSNGFSLLELLLVMLILLIITGAIFSNLINNQKVFDAEQANAEANANAQFAINRIKEILESSGNNPAQVASINDQTGGIVNMFSSLNGTPFSATLGITGTAVPFTPSTTNCGTGASINSYCGVAVDLLSDLNGNGTTTDDVSNGAGNTIFSRNIVTSEHVQLYLDNTINAQGMINNTIYLVNMNYVNGPRQTAVANFIVDLRFSLDMAKSNITVTVTARSIRAVAIESYFERRFRYANLTTTIRIRNMNSNVAGLINNSNGKNHKAA